MNLSTPSLGITEPEYCRQPLGHYFCFQLPLSGSPGENLRLYRIPLTWFLSTPSLGITPEGVRAWPASPRSSFNSLSRDHDCSSAGLWTRWIGWLSTPSLGITSRTTHAWAERIDACYFQLPLSGSLTHFGVERRNFQPELSTPSLGITSYFVANVLEPFAHLLSTPSLGITSRFTQRV